MKKKRLPHLGKLLLSEQHGDDFKCLNGYAYRLKDGYEEIHPSEICFSRLCQLTSVEVSEFVFSLENRFVFAGAQFKTDKVLANNFNSYVHYILNDSPFKDFFITKRVCDAHRYGVKCNTEKTISEYITGCIAIRESWEQQNNFAIWNTLVKAKIHKDIALILCCSLIKGIGDEFQSHNIVAKNHSIFGNSSKKKLSKFLMEGCVKINKVGFAIFETTQTKQRDYAYGDQAPDPILSFIKNPITRKSNWSNITFYKLADVVQFALNWEKELGLQRNYK